jgi:hypothetical protein
MSVTLTPEGDYVARITGWQFGLNQKGTHELDLRCLILGSPVVENDVNQGIEEFEGGPLKRTVFEYITDKTVDRVKRDLKAIGYDGDFSGKSFTPGNAASFDFVNQAAVKDGGLFLVHCGHDEYQEKVRERWTIVTRRLSGMNREGFSQFDSLFSEPSTTVEGGNGDSSRFPD